MRLGTTLAFLVVLTVGLSKVTCLTHRELYEFLIEYGREVQTTGALTDDITDTDDVIDVSGELDDEVDVEYLLQRLGLQPEVKYGFWRKKHHKKHKPEFHCSCTKDDCKCCVKHKFKFFSKTFELEGCMNVNYDETDHTFTLDFTVNGHSLYKHKVSLSHMAKLCFPIPGLGSLGKVCLEVYDVNLSKLHACAKLTGTIDLKIHKFSIHLKLGCFSIPTSQMGGFVQFANKQDRLRVDLLTEKDDEKSRDLSDNLRNLRKTPESDDDDTLRYGH